MSSDDLFDLGIPDFCKLLKAKHELDEQLSVIEELHHSGVLSNEEKFIELKVVNNEFEGLKKGFEILNI